LLTDGLSYLVTPRMRLRQFREGDAMLLYDLDGDPEVLRYLSRHRAPYDEVAGVILPGILRQYATDPRFGRWAADDGRTGEFLGWFSLDIDGPGTAACPELGYRLRQDAWGQGLATEGARALVVKAFREYRVDAVIAQTMAVNAGSRRVMEKCGMRHIRTFFPTFDDPLPGTEQGEVEYRITREEWREYPPDIREG
jgi:RimJ/RimL family protein N-acetyltransferase